MTLENTPSFFCHSLTKEFNSTFLENCAKLHDAKPYMDDEELEEIAYETTLKQFYYKAKDLFIKLDRNDWGLGIE